MKQLFLNRERIACMFLCVCARAVCVCNLSLFVRKPFCRPIVPGLLSPPSSPTSSTLPALLLLHHPLHFCSALSHFFHFVISLIPLLSSSRLASPSPSFVLAQKKIKRDCSVSEFSRLPRGQMTFPPRHRVGKATLREIYHRSNDFLQTSRIAFPPAESHPLSPIYNSPFILFHFQYFSHSAAL